MMPDPKLLEAKFGDRPGDDFPPADLGEFRLRGAIDRIDVEGSFALIRDYKLSAKVVAGAKLIEKGKLQLPLYMLAARGFGLEPIGALYSPLAATKEDEHRPRGLIDKTHKGTTVPDATEAHVRTDFIEPDAFEEIIAGRPGRGEPRRRRDQERRDRPQPAGRLMPHLVRARPDLPDRARHPLPRRRGRGRRGDARVTPGEEHEQLSLEAVEAPEPEPDALATRAESPAIGPTAQQRAAIDNRDRDVFLEAGAGTGKTRVLVERYCEAVDTDGIEPERILAFTFTEKAAAEMRRRVRVELGARAAAATETVAEIAAPGGGESGRGGADHDDPRVLSSPARGAPRRRRAGSAVPGARRRRGVEDRQELVRGGARSACRDRRRGRPDGRRLSQPARVDRHGGAFGPAQPRRASARPSRPSFRGTRGRRPADARGDGGDHGRLRGPA